MENCPTFQLYQMLDEFCVVPCDNDTQGQMLVINRRNGAMKLEQEQSHLAEYSTVHGLLGVINLPYCRYLIVITEASIAGRIDGNDIWKVDGTKMIPFKIIPPNPKYQMMDPSSWRRLVKDNRAYVSMLEALLQTPSFYFSRSHDMTHSVQRLHDSAGLREERFLWNRHLMKDFASRAELAKFVTPVIHGFVKSGHCQVGMHQLTYTVIARRSCDRAGARFFMRGADEHGHVANFVETEQIVEYQGNTSSFVQTRGSIPLFWTQRPNLKQHPKPELVPGSEHADCLAKHMNSLLDKYGKQVIINLINQTGSEDVLGKQFAHEIRSFANPAIKYEDFDLHHECRQMRYDRLSILLDRTSKDHREHCYFLRLTDGTVAHKQSGSFRTNCIDCLDRTNVVQSLLGRRNVQEVFIELAIVNEDENVEAFERLFKDMWADHADVISLQYSGTAALKTDFTRTGQRTKMGIVRDALNSVVRYCSNYFTDGSRQDAVDLFLGNYVVDGDYVVVDDVVPNLVFGMAVGVLVLVILCLFASKMLFLALILAASTYAVVYDGTEWTNCPQFVDRRC